MQIRNIVIPANITKFEEWAFIMDDENDLDSVTFLSSNPPQVMHEEGPSWGTVFDSLDQSIVIHIPSGSYQAYVDAGYPANYLKDPARA